MGLINAVKKAWNVFNRDPTRYQYNTGPGYSFRPDRVRFSRGNERSIVTSVYNRIALDVAALNIRHVLLDDEKRYKDEVNDGLNTCLSLEANIDQTGRSFIQDAVMSMMDEGCVALVPIETDDDVDLTDSYGILSMRTGKILEWYPRHVLVRVYNAQKGYQEDIKVPKSTVAIIENPLFAVMNEPNSTMQRLIRKLNLLDAIDEQSGSGKLDLIVQLPYTVKSDLKRAQAKERKKELEMQLAGSKYGVAYIDAAEKVTQLNRSVDNKGATRNGVLVGVYKYSYAKTVAEAEKEADAVLAVLNNRHLDFPVFYDLEWDKQAALGKAAIASIAKAFLNKITKAGYKAGIYCNTNWYKNILDTKTLNYDYWIASYPYKDNGTVQERLKPSAGIGWQYSSKGTVEGISGPVDMNLFYTDYKLDKNNNSAESIPVTTTKTLWEKCAELMAAQTGYMEKATEAMLDDKTATLGRNVNIDNRSVNIRNGTNVLAQFAESLIEIGKNTSTATISFLNGIVKLIGQKQTIEGTTFYDAHLLSTNMMTLGTGSTDPSSDKINSLISMNGMSGEREVLASVTDRYGHSTLTLIDSSASLYSDGDAGYSSVDVICNNNTSQVELRTNGSNGNRALVNYSHALQYWNNNTLLASYNGNTPCLWDGGAWMFASQSVTLNAPISEQPHGIIVIFALFDPTTNSLTNVMTNPFFVPKSAINYDYIFTMFWENAWQMCTKRVTIQNTCIIGNDQNKSAAFKANTGITTSPQYFVLRRVYGV